MLFSLVDKQAYFRSTFARKLVCDSHGGGSQTARSKLFGIGSIYKPSSKHSIRLLVSERLTYMGTVVDDFTPIISWGIFAGLPEFRKSCLAQCERLQRPGPKIFQ